MTEDEGYAIRTPEGIWRFKCPKCAFQFAKPDEELSGPLECPKCSTILIPRGKIRPSSIERNAKDNGYWKMS